MNNSSELRIRLALFPVVLLLCMGALFLTACKKEGVTTPSGLKERTITVITKEKDVTTGQYTNPAQHALVVLRRQERDGSWSKLDSSFTNEVGFYQYKNTWPVEGASVRIECSYLYEQRMTTLLLCEDKTLLFNFDKIKPDTACPDINRALLIGYSDWTGQTPLNQNFPANAGEYTVTRTLYVNGLQEPVCFTIPAIDPPFSIKAMYTSSPVTGNTVRVNPGESFTVEFAVSTRNIVKSDRTYDLQFSCCSKPASYVYSIQLQAEVVLLPCDCPVQKKFPITPDYQMLSVNTAKDYSGLFVLQNPQNCGRLFIDSIKQVPFAMKGYQFSGWTITYPLGPVTIDAGANFNVSARFSPFHAGPDTGLFKVYMHLENNVQCTVFVSLAGEACRNICPGIKKDTVFKEFSPNAIRYDFYQGVTGRVAFSPNSVCSITRNFLEHSIDIYLPDSACCPAPIDIQISVFDNEPAQIASQYFSVYPKSTMTIGKGTPTTLTVRFTSPTVNEFESLFPAKRQKTGTLADNTFSLRIQLSNSTCGTCIQNIDVQAIIGTFSEESPGDALLGYGQRSDSIRDAQRQVAFIPPDPQSNRNTPGQKVDIPYIDPIDKTYPFPPTTGDFYVTVEDTSVAYGQLPHKPPILLRVEGTRFDKIQKVASGYANQDFLKISPITTKLQQDFVANPNYFSRPSLEYTFPPKANSIKPMAGDVYVMYSSETWQGLTGQVPCELGLLYISDLWEGYGEETKNMHHLSGIYYFVIYPVIIF